MEPIAVPVGAWTNASRAELKENFKKIDAGILLKKIDSLEILQWNYKADSSNIKHIGPLSEDFYRLFGLGSDDAISSIDPAGIALAAIQKLYRENIALKNELESLKASMNELRKLVIQSK